MSSNLSHIVCAKDYVDFTVRYILTRKVPVYTEQSTGQNSTEVYGVLLEKVVINDMYEEIILEKACAYVSESEEAAIKILNILQGFEVTPMTLYDVLDTVLEREMLV